MLRRILFYLSFGILGLLFIISTTAAVNYEDSNILTATVEFAPSYSFVCYTKSSDSIVLYWSGYSPYAHNLKILKKINNNDVTIYTTTTDSGYFEDNGLSPSVTYNYRLLVDHTDSKIPDSYFPSQGYISCTTSLTQKPDPSNVQVYPISSSSLHITWKDNAVGQHTFLLQRIKLTPLKPRNFQFTQQGGNSVKISWYNDTNSQEYRGPYYHLIERSLSQDFSHSIYKKEITFKEDIDYGESELNPKTNYEFVDDGLQLNTTYYYSIKACSYILADIDKNGVDDSICSEAVTSTITIQPTITSRNNLSNFLSSIFQYMYKIFKNIVEIVEKVKAQTKVIQIDLNSYFEQFEQQLNFDNAPGAYDDNYLEAGVAYLYRVKVCDSNNNCQGEAMGAGQTFSAKASSNTFIKLCIRNSLCSQVPAVVDNTQAPNLNQCNVNADCRNVGTSRQTIKER